MKTYRFTARTSWKDHRWEAGQEVAEADFPAGTTLVADFLAAGVIEAVPEPPQPTGS